MGGSSTHARGRGEAGLSLVEVIVSALLVVLTSLAVYSGLDAASATSGVNKHRSVAGEIAQQDQDRMRAMAISELSNYRDSRTVTVNGIAYTTVSRADWKTDRSGTASCTGTDARANYLRISSQVSWAGMRIKPISVESLVAPPNGSFGPNQGSLAVQVNDRNAVGVPGVSVTLAGARSYTDVTNEVGCVLWGYLPTGSYTVTISRPGYVDPTGVAQPTKSVSVVGQATTTLTFDYDAATTITASFDTWNGSSWVPTTGSAFTTVSPTNGRTVFGGATRATTVTSGQLFPVASYGVYAGNCAGADPLAYGLPSQTVAMTPGVAAQVTLHEPPINLKVVNGASPVANATVKLTGTASGCGAMPSTTTGADGYIVDRAQPLGTYNACTEFTVNGTLSHVSAAISNTTLTGVSATLDRAAGVLAGGCP